MWSGHNGTGNGKGNTHFNMLAIYVTTDDEEKEEGKEKSLGV